eukprot:CAMPEP_0172791750 /NCGR_PEP_ID=MMETSP1074-20121228/208626_1 /TAXON_ID=2916 /ORGANISM="Ceratium fusus, Strain PA161109" /LENGTH=181 /DNA_ID=CAMNT_0013628811 /DNA_START=679 /DNA_END=1224 /DNA_ORIENTATION=+
MTIKPWLQQFIESLVILFVLQAKSFMGASQHHVIKMQGTLFSFFARLQRHPWQRNVTSDTACEAHRNQRETRGLKAQLLEQFKQLCVVQVKPDFQTANKKQFRCLAGGGCEDLSKAIHSTAKVVVMVWDPGIMMIENCGLSQQLAKELVPSSANLPTILILTNIQETFEIILQTETDHTWT